MDIDIYDLLHDFYCADAENCDRFEYKHFPADELRACYNCAYYSVVMKEVDNYVFV